jgi:hypothetical protein
MGDISSTVKATGSDEQLKIDKSVTVNVISSLIS